MMQIATAGLFGRAASRAGRLFARLFSRRGRPRGGLGLVGLVTAASITLAPQAALAGPDCPVGVYRLADGGVVDIAPSEGDTLRWRRLEGATGALTRQADGRWTSTYGWTGRPDGVEVRFEDCAAGGLVFGGVAGRRIPLAITDTSFQSQQTRLAGRLVLPPGSARVPIVVLVHGSEDTSALKFYALQRILPAGGVGVFVYDKRGTGASAGKYTQDFSVLADDAVAAMRRARRLAGARAGRVGYQGGSQGGWVVPIAASRARVDFAIQSFGLAVSVIDEDREEVELEMRLKGHSQAEIDKALEVATAAETLFESRFSQGFEAFDAVRAKYRNEPWYKDLHGNFTWLILPKSAAELRAKPPEILLSTPFRYDPMVTLSRLGTPQLWVLGGMDLDAPSAETARRLRGLMAKGLPITLSIYPDAEHGMTEFERAADGERVSTRYSPGYFLMLRDFALRGRLEGAYGPAQILAPGARQADKP